LEPIVGFPRSQASGTILIVAIRHLLKPAPVSAAFEVRWRAKMSPVGPGCSLPSVVSVWFGVLYLNRILHDSQERWMLLVESNMARSVFILIKTLHGRDCAVVLGLPVHLPPDTEVVLRCTPGGLLMRETGCRFCAAAAACTLFDSTLPNLRPPPSPPAPLPSRAMSRRSAA